MDIYIYPQEKDIVKLLLLFQVSYAFFCKLFEKDTERIETENKPVVARGRGGVGRNRRRWLKGTNFRL